MSRMTETQDRITCTTWRKGDVGLTTRKSTYGGEVKAGIVVGKVLADALQPYLENGFQREHYGDEQVDDVESAEGRMTREASGKAAGISWRVWAFNHHRDRV